MNYSFIEPDYKFLLTGATGQIGHEMLPFLKKIGNVWAPSRSEFNLSDTSSISKKIHNYKPDMIVNLAAYTDVEGAETNHKTAHYINQLAPRVLAKESNKLSIPLIHFSTDYVFDGKKGRPYIETDVPNPLNVYGKSKLKGEEEIQNNHDKYLIIRAAWVYNKTKGKNFYRTIADLCKSQNQFNVVDNEIGNPTSAEFIAKKMYDVIIQINRDKKIENLWGVYHLVEDEAISRYDFARKILADVKIENKAISTNIKAIKSHEYKTLAKRPKNSVLSVDKFNKTFSLKG